MPYADRTMTGSFAGAEGEVDYRVHFEVTSKGWAGRGADFHGPGDPPEPPEWELDYVEHEGVDIRKTHSPEEIAHIESWAADLDLSDEVAEASRDQEVSAAEYRADLRDER